MRVHAARRIGGPCTGNICICIRGDSNACEAMRLGPARWEFGSFVPAGLVYVPHAYVQYARMHVYIYNMWPVAMLATESPAAGCGQCMGKNSN